MRKLLYSLFLFLISGPLCFSQNYFSLEGGFGHNHQYISEFTDLLYRATDRFTVTPNNPCLFQGYINDNCWTIPAGGSAQTITIDLTGKGEVPSGGLTYPYGHIYISFYHTYIPGSVSGRVKDASGTWRNLTDWTNVSNNVSWAIWRGTVPLFNYLTVIELTITPSSTTQTWVSKIEYHQVATDRILQGNYISKYWDNKLFTNLSFSDNNNVSTLKLKTDGGAYFGNTVGIGTQTPNSSAKLDVNGNIFTNGKIAIGTTDATKMAPYALVVNGEAIFNKARVKLYSTWPDYVFHKSYQLPSLLEIEAYIKKYNHLPDIPAAIDVEENGIDLGGNQAILLKKIEELTLYLIQMQKDLDQHKLQIANQQKEIDRLKKQATENK